MATVGALPIRVHLDAPPDAVVARWAEMLEHPVGAWLHQRNEMLQNLFVEASQLHVAAPRLLRMPPLPAAGSPDVTVLVDHQQEAPRASRSVQILRSLSFPRDIEQLEPRILPKLGLGQTEEPGSAQRIGCSSALFS